MYGRFTFIQQFQRLDTLVQGPPFVKSGNLLVQSKIRKIGQQHWLTQTYPVVIEVVTPLLENLDQDGTGLAADRLKHPEEHDKRDA